MCRRSMRQWSSAFSIPAARLPARRCANITACLAVAIPVRPARCTIRANAATPPADRPRAARRLSLPVRWIWRSAATKPASIRIPASHCGIVGLKPTFGLVPYTGIGLLEITIDTCGPMTANVRDNALLLEVIAGPDGLDTRQRGVAAGRYTEALAGGVKGMRIAVIKEGFGHPNSEPDVDAHVRDAARRFAKLSAIVEEVSVPTHALGFPVWAAIRGDAACVMLLEMNGAGIGQEGLYVTSLLDHAMGWRERADEFADTLKIASIFSKYTLDRYGGHFYAKAQNLRRRVRAGYDAVLATHDLLLLPTVPMKATPIPGKNATPQEITRRSWEPTRNTCPFNVTGHPAISVPCGMGDGRPIGLMLVGRHYAEETIYRAAAAFEQSGDWMTF